MMGNATVVPAAGAGAEDASGAQSVTVRFAPQLLEIIRALNSEHNVEAVAHKAIMLATELMGCQRASIFMIDSRATEQLVVRFSSAEEHGIRMDKRQGLAGYVLESGEVLNIPDAYEDDRFLKDIDQSTGFQTKSVLCFPINDAEGNIVAILQLINKVDPSLVAQEQQLRLAEAGSESTTATHRSSTSVPAAENGQSPRQDLSAIVPFTSDDEELAGYVAAHLGVILRNLQLYEVSRTTHERLQAMMDVVRAMYSRDLGANSVLHTLSQSMPRVLNADRCTVYRINRKRGLLESTHGDIDIQIPIDSSIAGEVASTGQPINLADAYDDERFNRDVDQESGYRTRAMLCMPIFNSSGTVIAVVQLINKVRDPIAAFLKDEQDMLADFLSLLGSILERSPLFIVQSDEPTPELVGSTAAGGTSSPAKKRQVARSADVEKFAIPEGDEDGEEDEEEEEAP